MVQGLTLEQHPSSPLPIQMLYINTTLWHLPSRLTSKIKINFFKIRKIDDLIEVNLEHENKTIRALLTATEIEEVSNDATKLIQYFKKLEYQQQLLKKKLETRNQNPSSSTSSIIKIDLGLGSGSPEQNRNDESESSEPVPMQENTKKDVRFKWTDDSIKLLLDYRLGQEDKFNMPTCKKTKLWQKISILMKTVGGYNLTGDECYNKYRNLLQTYRFNNDKRHKMTGESKITWEYFNIFDEVLGTKQSSAPKELLLSSSLEKVEKENKAEKPKPNEERKVQKVLKENKMCLNEYLFYKTQRMETIWEEKKGLKEQEINAMNNLADAIRASSSKKRRHSSDSD
ncbi:unnamed protein product [Psylliodes chrysocephalus]|uniref:Myb/SANT-like DNA-binding domain-containing protein n=1 Tax=Psylliodes chrysocephalus TaxID=3402493 RepID=A0A9P0GF27_9CUCU|nr:unnamed protein product [Psylliodes chrysocephala]